MINHRHIEIMSNMPLNGKKRKYANQCLILSNSIFEVLGLFMHSSLCYHPVSSIDCIRSSIDSVLQILTA